MSEPNTSDFEYESETIDTHLSVLASTECRYVLYYFQSGSEDVASLWELADFVETNVGSALGRSEDQIVTRLHHHSLPRLEDSGAVEYDPGDGLVRYRGNAGLEEFAAIAASEERRET